MIARFHQDGFEVPVVEIHGQLTEVLFDDNWIKVLKVNDTYLWCYYDDKQVIRMNQLDPAKFSLIEE